MPVPWSLRPRTPGPTALVGRVRAVPASAPTAGTPGGQGCRGEHQVAGQRIDVGGLFGAYRSIVGCGGRLRDVGVGVGEGRGGHVSRMPDAVAVVRRRPAGLGRRNGGAYTLAGLVLDVGVRRVRRVR